jgi:hypothetical protein
MQQLLADHRQLMAGKGDNTDFVADLRSNLPTGAVLKDIGIDNTGIQILGIIDDPFNIIAYIKSLEASGYTVSLQEIDEDDEGQFAFHISLSDQPAEIGQ